MKRMFTCLVVATMAMGAAAQNLWRDVPMRANPAEIQALMPEARETSAEQRAADPGALLEIPSTDIAGEDFAATFHFEAGRLQRIRLLAQPPTRDRMQALLKTLEASLRQRYGLPISHKTRRIAPLGSFDRLWSFRRMTVQLQGTEDNANVELTYSVNIPNQPGGL